jgi:hypothetical protein
MDKIPLVVFNLNDSGNIKGQLWEKLLEHLSEVIFLTVKYFCRSKYEEDT